MTRIANFCVNWPFFEEFVIGDEHIITDNGKELNKNLNLRSEALQVRMVVGDSLIRQMNTTHPIVIIINYFRSKI